MNALIRLPELLICQQIEIYYLCMQVSVNGILS